MLDRGQKFTNFAGPNSIHDFDRTTEHLEDPVPTNPDANKDIIRSFVAAWNDRDFDRFDQLMAPGATLAVGGVTVPCDPPGTRAIAQEWTTAFPDWQFEPRALIAEDDLVVAHMPYRGTFERPISGLAPTGRHAVVDEMVIFRIGVTPPAGPYDPDAN